jgi:RNA polymerase sigma-70 factor (ECF subfamily)
MAQLPYQQREVILLHLVNDLRFREIAAALEISPNTAKSRYRYGLQKLRSQLNGEVTE